MENAKGSKVTSIHIARKKPYTQKELEDLARLSLREYEKLNLKEPKNFVSGKASASQPKEND